MAAGAEKTPASDDEQERRSKLLLPHEGSSLGRSLRGAPAGASRNATAGPAASETASQAEAML
jgi:hypothetical protein